LQEPWKCRKRICNYQTLILDERLNYKLSGKDAKNLYELFGQRSGNHSTAFAGRYPVDGWRGRPGGGTQANPIIGRFTLLPCLAVAYWGYEAVEFISYSNSPTILPFWMMCLSAFFRKFLFIELALIFISQSKE
jgi:hypothetical protein